MAVDCDSDTVEDVDAALSMLAFDQRRVSDTEAWLRYVDKLLDLRLTLVNAARG